MHHIICLCKRISFFLFLFFVHDDDEQELAEVVREFRAEGGNDSKGPRGGENKVLYDDFVDMLVVGSPRWVVD